MSPVRHIRSKAKESPFNRGKSRSKWDISSRMRRLASICSLVLLLLTNPHACQSQGIKCMENGTTILSPGSISGHIESIKWLQNDDIIADSYRDEKRFFRHCEGRCDINTETGSLTINSWSLIDCGNFTVKIRTKTGKLDLFNLNVTNCGKHTVKINSTDMKNVPDMKNVDNNSEGWNTETIIIIIIISVFIIAVALSFAIYCCCCKRRQNPEHLTGRIWRRGLSWLRPAKSSIGSTPISFQVTELLTLNPTEHPERTPSRNTHD
ncbi:uncharacterized protein LOC112142028 [Oryzias melastigma]|uniref:uncharacterized protein LOC112142028 n=1 Tax=Oryzias melastigma TaxID=30732 RepID=UPI000CF80A60|nr:uncharacterized protein LOC112142028 [Oryzias melastigma]